MPLPLYLAMTGAEVAAAEALPEKTAWMACHFSCYGTGLSNMPQELPEGSLLILNDRTPICGHDPERIAEQLEQLVCTFSCCGVLLDFQRPCVAETAELCAHLVTALPCPVGITDIYARELDCPVFLSPLPPGTALIDHISPWAGRELWLETVADTRVAVITETGCTWQDSSDSPAGPTWFEEPSLHCRYCWHADRRQAVFTLERTTEHIPTLLEEAERLGITRAVGLYQQLGQIITTGRAGGMH